MPTIELLSCFTSGNMNDPVMSNDVMQKYGYTEDTSVYFIRENQKYSIYVKVKHQKPGFLADIHKLKDDDWTYYAVTYSYVSEQCDGNNVIFLPFLFAKDRGIFVSNNEESIKQLKKKTGHYCFNPQKIESLD